MSQFGNEAAAGAHGPMPDFMVVPLDHLTPDGLETVHQTLARLGLTALYGDEATEFIESYNAANASGAESTSTVHYASYEDFEAFGEDQSASFRIWRNLSHVAAHYPTREMAELAPDYNELKVSARRLVGSVETYLRMVDYSPDGRPVEEIDLNGVYAFLKILLKNGYKIKGSPIRGVGATGYGILARFVNEKLQPDPPLPLNV